MANIRKSIPYFTAALLMGLSTASVAEYGLQEALTPIQSNNWYVNAFGGVAFPQCTAIDGTVEIDGLIISGHNIRTEYDVGWDVGGGFGYRSGPMRYEVQYIFQRANIDTVAGVDVSGSVKVNAGLFNVLYSFGDVGAAANPYLGAGIGYSNIAQTFRPSNGEFAYDAKAGLEFHVLENAAFGVGYQFFGATHSDTLGDSFFNHMINASIIYYVE